MDTFYYKGYVIAARSKTQALFAAEKLEQARVPTDYDPDSDERPEPEFPAWLATDECPVTGEVR